MEEAEIQGRFNGSLVVRKQLLIKAIGRVSEPIRFGQIGDVQAQPSSEHGEVIADAMSVRVAS